jgi:photosystem II stability/assembly factor-like uncharacterized protein
MKYTLAFLFLISHTLAGAQHATVHVLSSEIPSSIRAMSVLSDDLVWIAGSKGYVARSRDGGKTFDQLPVPGMDSADFRSLIAFNDSTAIVACTGTPALIYYMSDGKTWKEVYHNPHHDAFIDGIDFWNNREGIVYGDPIDGQLLLLRTSDGGQSWQELPEQSRPLMAPGESSFAASGTNIRCYGDSLVRIATGGTVSRMFTSTDRGVTWTSAVTPILQGKESTGIFSFDFVDDQVGVITGGDYLQDTLKTDHVFYTLDGGISWQAPINPTRGYRECVLFLDAKTILATGPGGTDRSVSSGRNWEPMSDEQGFHVMKKSPQGKRIYFAGKNKVGFLNK